MCLDAHDFLLEHGRDECLENPVGAAEPEGRELPDEIAQAGMDRLKAGRIVSCAELAGQRGKQPAAPGPQAAPDAMPGREVTRSVPGPSGVSDVRQIAPEGSMRNAGSPGPRRCTRSAWRRLTGNGAGQTRLSPASGPTFPPCCRLLGWDA